MYHQQHFEVVKKTVTPFTITKTTASRHRNRRPDPVPCNAIWDMSHDASGWFREMNSLPIYLQRDIEAFLANLPPQLRDGFKKEGYNHRVELSSLLVVPQDLDQCEITVKCDLCSYSVDARTKDRGKKAEWEATYHWQSGRKRWIHSKTRQPMPIDPCRIYSNTMVEHSNGLLGGAHALGRKSRTQKGRPYSDRHTCVCDAGFVPQRPRERISLKNRCVFGGPVHGHGHVQIMPPTQVRTVVHASHHAVPPPATTWRRPFVPVAPPAPVRHGAYSWNNRVTTAQRRKSVTTIEPPMPYRGQPGTASRTLRRYRNEIVPTEDKLADGSAGADGEAEDTATSGGIPLTVGMAALLAALLI